MPFFKRFPFRFSQFENKIGKKKKDELQASFGEWGFPGEGRCKRRSSCLRTLEINTVDQKKAQSKNERKKEEKKKKLYASFFRLNDELCIKNRLFFSHFDNVSKGNAFLEKEKKKVLRYFYQLENHFDFLRQGYRWVKIDVVERSDVNTSILKDFVQRAKETYSKEK